MDPVPLTLDLAGPVRLHDRSGRDLTPRLTRSRAVLALLGATEGHRRSRAWIQDKLWSEKPGPEGRSALRYTLWDLRKALGPHRSALLSEGDCLALDPAAVAVRLPRAGHPGPDAPIFAEGLDVDDAEFECWLRRQRAGTDAGVPLPFLDEGSPRILRSSVRFFPDGGDDDHLVALSQTLVTRIAARLVRTTGAVVGIGVEDAPRPGAFALELRVDLRLSRVRGRVLAQVSVTHVGRDEIVWTNDRDLPRGLSGQDPLNPFANLTAEAIARALTRLPDRPTDAERAAVSFCQALAMPRSFGARDLTSAIEVLGALDIEELDALAAARRALYLGWTVIERLATDPEAALDEARELSRLSLRLDPTLAEAYAVRSELADFDRDPTLAHDFARRAVEIDPFDPMSVAALAKAEARSGNGKAAYQQALFAQKLALGAANPAWWAMLCCSTALGQGDATLALRHAGTAHELSPGFRPPLRFLGALRFMTGDIEGCDRALSTLATHEPGFAVAHLAEPDYPLRSLDRSLLRKIARRNWL